MPKELQLPALAIAASIAFVIWVFSSAEGIITDKDIKDFKEKIKKAA